MFENHLISSAVPWDTRELTSFSGCDSLFGFFFFRSDLWANICYPSTVSWHWTQFNSAHFTTSNNLADETLPWSVWVLYCRSQLTFTVKLNTKQKNYTLCTKHMRGISASHLDGQNNDSWRIFFILCKNNYSSLEPVKVAVKFTHCLLVARFVLLFSKVKVDYYRVQIYIFFPLVAGGCKIMAFPFILMKMIWDKCGHWMNKTHDSRHHGCTSLSQFYFSFKWWCKVI